MTAVEVARLKPSTMVAYRLAVASATRAMGDIPVGAVTVPMVQRWLREVGETHSAQSVCHYRSVLRVALHEAQRCDMVARNVASLAQPPRVPFREMHTLSAAQTRTLLSVSEDHRLHALFVLAVHCGMRLSEMLGLGWRDVDFGACILTVRNTLVRVDGEFRLDTPKTHRSARAMRLNADTVAALRRHRAQQAEEYLGAGRAGEPNGLVFTTVTGLPIHRSTANKLWHAQLRRAGLPSLPFHSARHGFATMQLEAGTSARVVQAALGHSTPNITLSIYSHVRPALASEAADRMQEALRGPSTAVRDSSSHQQGPAGTASGRLN